MRGAFVAVGLMCLLFAGLPVSSAPKAGDERIIASNTTDVLKGLSGVYVLIEEIKKDAQKDGLEKDAIQTDVELKLRQSGIKVLTRGEVDYLPDGPVLYVTVCTPIIFLDSF